MAKAKKTSSQQPKWKKKKWFEIVAPKLFNNASLGKTPAFSPEEVPGRHIKANAMHLVGDMKKQNTIVEFQVEEVKGEKAYTKLIGQYILPAAVKRFVRRDKNRLDDSFCAKTKDGIQVRVKPFTLTKARTSGSVKQALRQRVLELLHQKIGGLEFENLQNEVLQGRLQKDISNELKTIYPLRTFQIRSVYEETEAKAAKSEKQNKIRLEKKTEVEEDDAEEVAEQAEA